ncbi:MAG: iron ABC transporter permease [Lentisphaerae bacterium]|nr:iron ABC transporter permease [Lentisphaerota bacterium]
MTRKFVLFLALIIATPLVLLGCVMFGASGIGLPDISTETGRAIMQLRANRVVVGFIVGAALSGAGVVFQAILRNSLAEPYILGVSSGAALGAAVAILTGFATVSVFALPITTFATASITLTTVFLLARKRGTPSVYNLILSGVIVSAVCSSVLMFLVSRAPTSGLHNITWWMLGNLQPTSGQLLAVSSVIIIIGTTAIWLMSPELNALALGRETAHNLGIRTDVMTVTGLALATMIASTAVGISGLIGFVGLIVPHVMRTVFGPTHKRLIPASALGGGLFLALCDAIARTVTSPEDIPVGVITAVFGGPFFLAILRKKGESNWSG